VQTPHSLPSINSWLQAGDEEGAQQLQILLQLFYASFQLTHQEGWVMGLCTLIETRLSMPITLQRSRNLSAQARAVGSSNKHYLLWETDYLFATT